MNCYHSSPNRSRETFNYQIGRGLLRKGTIAWSHISYAQALVAVIFSSVYILQSISKLLNQATIAWLGSKAFRRKANPQSAHLTYKLLISIFRRLAKSKSVWQEAKVITCFDPFYWSIQILTGSYVNSFIFVIDVKAVGRRLHAIELFSSYHQTKNNQWQSAFHLFNCNLADSQPSKRFICYQAHQQSLYFTHLHFIFT